MQQPVAKPRAPRGIPLALAGLLLAPFAAAQQEPAPVERLRLACAANPRDEAAIAEATTAVARLPRADLVREVDALLALVDALPARALAPMATALGTAAPWAGKDRRARLTAWAGTIDERATAAVKSDPALLAPLALATARLFGRAMVGDDLALDDLLNPVRNEWEYARVAALEVIEERGAKAKAAADELVAFLEKSEHPTGHTKLAGEYVRMDDAPEAPAARALLAVGDAPTHRALACAALAVHAPEATARREAVQQLMGCGAELAAKYAKELESAAADRDVAVVREVATALGLALPRQPSVRLVLERLAAHEDAQVRARAKAALASVRTPG